MQAQAGHQAVVESASSSGGAPTAADPACLDQTIRLLQEYGLAAPAELHQLREHGLAPQQGPRPWDPLEFLAALRVSEPMPDRWKLNASGVICHSRWVSHWRWCPLQAGCPRLPFFTISMRVSWENAGD